MIKPGRRPMLDPQGVGEQAHSDCKRQHDREIEDREQYAGLEIPDAGADAEKPPTPL